MQPRIPRRSRSSTPPSFIHAVMAPTTIVRQPLVWDRLWGRLSWLSTAASVWSDPLVRHHALPTTTVWQLLLPHQPALMGKAHRKPSRQLGHDRTWVSVFPTTLTAGMRQAVCLNGLSDERCNCRSQARTLAGVKNGFYCCSRTGLIALPIEV